jgi:hypothetical protein
MMGPGLLNVSHLCAIPARQLLKLGCFCQAIDVGYLLPMAKNWRIAMQLHHNKVKDPPKLEISGIIDIYITENRIASENMQAKKIS